MKKGILMSTLVVLAILSATGSAVANDVTADIMSAYVWRGQVLNNEAVLQPAFTLEAPIGFYLNTWANVDMTDKFDNSWEFTEVDLTVGYVIPMPEDSIIGIEIGAVEFLFPKEGDWSAEVPEDETHADVETKGHDADTRELFAVLSLDTILSPSLAVNYDCDAVNGWYINASVAQGFELAEGLDAEIGASIGWASDRYNNAYFGVDDAKFNDCNIGASLAYAVTEEVSVGATVAYTFLLDSKIKDGAKEIYDDKDLFYGGLNLAYAF
ncbi:MAG: hypothetical protein EOM20_05340 [Spartobacteria bacterium]|nr:hypothetical protein [Spartobacteria bacterium]